MEWVSGGRMVIYPKFIFFFDSTVFGFPFFGSHSLFLISLSFLFCFLVFLFIIYLDGSPFCLNAQGYYLSSLTVFLFLTGRSFLFSFPLPV